VSPTHSPFRSMRVPLSWGLIAVALLACTENPADSPDLLPEPQVVDHHAIQELPLGVPLDWPVGVVSLDRHLVIADRYGLIFYDKTAPDTLATRLRRGEGPEDFGRRNWAPISRRSMSSPSSVRTRCGFASLVRTSEAFIPRCS